MDDFKVGDRVVVDRNRIGTIVAPASVNIPAFKGVSVVVRGAARWEVRMVSGGGVECIPEARLKLFR